MSIGHGTPGLLSGLRSFSGLMDSLIQLSRQGSEPFVDYCLGLPVEPSIDRPMTSWVVHSGAIYRYRWQFGDEGSLYGILTTYDGILRDIVGVESMILPRPLVRVRSIAAMTAGTYFADINHPVFGGTRVEIYIWLPDGSNPSEVTVLLDLLWTVGVRGAIHPYLGPSDLVDGGIEDWIDPDELSHWEFESNTGWTLAQVPAVAPEGLYAAKISLSGTGTRGGLFSPFAEAPATVAGDWWRMSGYYSTMAAGMPAGTYAAIKISNGVDTQDLMVDGRNDQGVNITHAYPLEETHGAVRRFLFDFVVPTGWTSLMARVMGRNASGGSAVCDVTFDGVLLQPIYRFNNYRPDLGMNALPSQEIMSQSIAFGQKTLSIGTMSLNNAEGAGEIAFDQLICCNRPAQVYVGGYFPDDGQEVYRDNWHSGFPARMRLAEVGDKTIVIELEDIRGLAKVLSPPNNYSLEEQPDMDPNREGDVKPHMFGDSEIHSIKAVRTGIGANGYGAYEVLDPEIPDGELINVGVGTIKSYPNEEFADKDERGLLLTNSTTEFSFNSNLTLWSIVCDARNYKYDRGGNDVGTGSIFDFNIGGAELHADLDISGTADQAAAALAARMNAVASSPVPPITVVYDNPTHKTTVARSSGPLSLLPKTGANAHKQSWKLSGFDTGADRTGASTYTGDDPTFENPEADHVLRFTSTGYLDDASGFVTGTPNDPINTHPAMASWLLQKIARVPPSKIDVASFAAAHAIALAEGMMLRAHITEQNSLDQMLAELDVAGMMDTVVDGAGVWRCIKNETVVRRTFSDADYLEDSFRMWRDPAQVFAAIKVFYAQHSAQQKFLKTVERSTDPGLAVKYGTDEIREIMSWLVDDRSAAATLAQRHSNFSSNGLAQTPRLARFAAAGKLIDLLPGHLISLTRSRALDASGMLSDVQFRIFGLSSDYVTGRSICSAVENIQYLTPPFPED